MYGKGTQRIRQEGLAIAVVIPVMFNIWVHPGMASVAQAEPNSPDYWDAVQTTEYGYLRWHSFPVRVAMEPVTADPDTFAEQQQQQWRRAIHAAIQDWQVYFPLELTEATQGESIPWDIYIHRQRPPARRLADGTILPARLADTRYTVADSDLPLNPTANTGIPGLQVQIRIGTQQGFEGLRATARHELGHALGLWGHSPNPNDVMYPAQNGLYPPISDRDLQTLQRLYGDIRPR